MRTFAMYVLGFGAFIGAPFAPALFDRRGEEDVSGDP